MHFSLRHTKVACRPRLYLTEATDYTEAGNVIAPNGKAVELRGPWEGEATILRDHQGRCRVVLEIVPLSKSATIALDYGDPEPAGEAMPSDVHGG